MRFTSIEHQSMSKSLAFESTDDEDNPFAPEEEQRLGSQGALKTCVILSVGPLLSEVVYSFSSLANSLWAVKALGDEAMDVFGAVFVVEFLPLAIAEYLMISVSIRASYLCGKQAKNKIAQMLVDFIRFAFILSVVLPAVMLPLVKPIVKWFGADDKLADDCFLYMIPMCAGAFVDFLFMIGCGLCQAEGRSFLYAIIMISAFGLNMVLFNPLLLLVCKTKIWGSSLSMIMGEAVPGIIVMIFIFRGKMDITPRLRMFWRKFSPELWHGLSNGFPQLVVQLSATFPQLLMQKFVNDAAGKIGEYDVVLQVWSVVERVYAIVGALCIGFSYGFLPAASYAYGAKRYHRVRELTIHAMWLATSSSTVLSLVALFLPRQVCSIWSKNEHFLDWCQAMLPKVFLLSPFFAIQYVAPALLEALQDVCLATILSLSTLFVGQAVFSTALHFTKPDDPARVLWTYPINDGFSLILCAAFLIQPFLRMARAPEDPVYTEIRPSRSDGELLLLRKKGFPLTGAASFTEPSPISQSPDSQDP